jgi:membrane protease YdiL (CAAX protease family)
LDEELLRVEESSPLSTPQPAKRGVHWVFVGSDGLRAGWGVLLFVLLYVGFLFLTGWALRSFLRQARHVAVLPVRLALIMEFAQCLPTILATAIMALIERRSLLAYGYKGSARAVRFVSGLVWGFVALSALVLVLWKARLLAFDGELLHDGAILKYALAWGLMFLVVAVFEESTLRGYLQFTLTRGIGFWWGALLLSLLFGFSHGTNPGETPVGLFSAAGVGLVFCISLWYTGSLWWALGFHASWDWAESYFYGTSDSGLVVQGHLLGEHPVGQRLWSGGTTGPEGSLLVLILLVIIALLMWLWWGPRTQSPFTGSGWRPAWSRKPIETV